MLELLRATYCGKIGCEYMYIQQPEQKLWLQERMEPQTNNWPHRESRQAPHSRKPARRRRVRTFPDRRYIGQKRFSLEGAETAIAILDELAEPRRRGQRS